MSWPQNICKGFKPSKHCGGDVGRAQNEARVSAWGGVGWGPDAEDRAGVWKALSRRRLEIIKGVAELLQGVCPLFLRES